MPDSLIDSLDLARVLGELRDTARANRKTLNELVDSVNTLTTEIALIRQGQRQHGAAIALLDDHVRGTTRGPKITPLPAMASER